MLLLCIMNLYDSVLTVFYISRHHRAGFSNYRQAFCWADILRLHRRLFTFNPYRVFFRSKNRECQNFLPPQAGRGGLRQATSQTAQWFTKDGVVELILDAGCWISKNQNPKSNTLYYQQQNKGSISMFQNFPSLQEGWPEAAKKSGSTMFYEGRGGDPDTRYWMPDTRYWSR